MTDQSEPAADRLSRIKRYVDQTTAFPKVCLDRAEVVDLLAMAEQQKWTPVKADERWPDDPMGDAQQVSRVRLGWVYFVAADGTRWFVRLPDPPEVER